MKRTTLDQTEVTSWVELLEDRIAPAALDPGSFHSAPVGSPVLLHAGEGLASSNSGGAYLLYVEKGQALVFTTDLNANGQLDPNEITGIAAGNGLRLTSFVDIHGDIVTNLNANGTLTDSDPNAPGADGKILLNSKIEAITLRSVTDADLNPAIPGETVANRSAPSTYSIYGNIYAGAGFGMVGGGLTINTTGATGSNADKVPGIGSIVVGTATSGQFFNFGVTGNEFAVSGIFGKLTEFKVGSGVAGADIIGVKAGETISTQTTTITTDPSGNPTSTTKTTNTFSSIDFTIGALLAGDGGFGARGGNIENIALKGDVGTFTAIAGDGGDGDTGGAGGSILNLTNGGSQWGAALLQTGIGGKGLIGKGGNGGTMQLGDFASSGKLDIILGDGGDGLTGGGTGASFSGVISPFTSAATEGLAIVSTKHVTGTIGKQNFIDFDGDTLSDIVYLSTDPQQLVVIFGSGNIKFLDVPILEPLETSTAGLTVADLNGDGYDDIVMATNSTNTSADLLTYLYNANTGTFDLGIHSALPFFTQSIIGLEAGDFDGDGIIDIGILSYVAGGTTVYFAKGVNDGNGDGSGLFVVDYGINAISSAATKVPISLLSPGELPAKIIATSTTTGGIQDILVGAVFESALYSSINALTYDGAAWTKVSATGYYQGWKPNPDYPTVDPNPANQYIHTGIPVLAVPIDFTVLDLNGDGEFDVAAVNGGAAEVALTLFQGTAGGGLSQPDPTGVKLYGNLGVLPGQEGVFEVITGPKIGDISGIVALDLAGMGNFNTFGIYVVGDLGDVLFYQFAAAGFGQGDVTQFSALPVLTGLGPLADGALFDAFRYDVAGGAAGYSVIAYSDPASDTQILNIASLPPQSYSLYSKQFDLAVGDGGDSVLGSGGAGGSVNSLNLGSGVGVATVTAGDGGNGTINGGAGGKITGVNILSGGFVYFSAGDGGNGISGSGGMGGSIAKFTIKNGIELTAGNGGTGYVGGAGGSIVGAGKSVVDNEAKPSFPQDLIFTAGNGGSGIASGGDGGGISNFCLIAGTSVSSLMYLSGAGGSALAGRGGIGGSIVNSSPSGQVNLFEGPIGVYAGAGGSGLIGGKGGSISNFANSPSQFGVNPSSRGMVVKE